MTNKEIVNLPQHLLFATANSAGQQLEPDIQRFPSSFDSWVAHNTYIPDVVKTTPFPGYRKSDMLWECNSAGFRASRGYIDWTEYMQPDGKVDEKAFGNSITRVKSQISNYELTTLTLHHLIEPEYITAMGGWANPETKNMFIEYAKKVVLALGGEMKYIEIFNEINTFAFAQLAGEVPLKNRLYQAVSPLAVRNMIDAHNQLYDWIHDCYQKEGWGKVFVSSSVQDFRPHSVNNNLAEKTIACIHNKVSHTYFMDLIKKDGVFIHSYLRLGINIKDPRSWRNIAPFPAQTWIRDPTALAEAVAYAADCFSGELLVTEFGYFDRGSKDNAEGRSRHFIESILYLAKLLKERPEISKRLKMIAIWQGVDTREWANEEKLHFHILKIDPRSKVRILTPYAKVIKSVIRNNGVPRQLAERFGLGDLFNSIYN